MDTVTFVCKAFTLALLLLLSQFLQVPVCAKDSDYVKRYNDALVAYRSKDYLKVKKLLEPVSRNKITEAIEYDGRAIYVGPAILDLLGWTYVDEKKYVKALKMFKQMEKFYPKEEFSGRLEGEQSYGGSGGAVGLINQILLYLIPGSPSSGAELKANCKAVLDTSRKLIKRYPNVIAPCWESCDTFADKAVNYSEECLYGSTVSAKEFDASIGGLIGLLPPESKQLVARTRMQIAAKYREEGGYYYATKIYREVAQKYSNVYYVNEEDGIDELYGPDSIAAILQIQRDQKANPSDIQKTIDEIRGACESLLKAITEGSSEGVKVILQSKCSMLQNGSVDGE